MYIPRPAKLLFQHDDVWSRYLDKHGDSLSDCTRSCFFCQSCKSKACSSCGLKATEQWLAEQQHILPDCDWQHITYMNASRLQGFRGFDVDGRLQLYIRPYCSMSCGPR
uniref:transposase zinc-binding domain-containing protein n=1 Tax=Serratia ureilytica TaxID=300181 RepID=UPI0037043329